MKTVSVSVFIQFLIEVKPIPLGVWLVNPGSTNCKHEKPVGWSTIDLSGGGSELHMTLCQDCRFLSRIDPSNPAIEDAFLGWLSKKELS